MMPEELMRQRRDFLKLALAGALSSVSATYAGAQGVYLGEDQINIQLPASLAGAGLVNVTLNVDGQTSNPVQIQIK